MEEKKEIDILVLNDLIQKEPGKVINNIPEIRVWCHPHFVKEDGEDYYEVFSSFEEALSFIKNNPKAEKAPSIAFRGKEINIFELPEG